MKNLNHKDPHSLLEKIKQLENAVGEPAFDLESREDIQVKIRVSESVGPGMFKPDPLVPGGYIANSLTIRAMRPDIFVTGDTVEDLAEAYQCACGKNFDLQFWKLCPYCAREIKV